MKRIATIIDRGPFRFEQVWREGYWAIYRQTQQGSDWERFEVIHIHRRNARKIGQIQIEAMEGYPSSEEWGTYAWTAITFDRAKAIVERERTSRASSNSSKRLES